MNLKPTGTRERKRPIAITAPRRSEPPTTTWRPSTRLLAAVRDRFRQSSDIPVPAELASEVLSILPFADVIARLNGGGDTIEREETAPLQLELRIDDAQIEGLY